MHRVQGQEFLVSGTYCVHHGAEGRVVQPSFWIVCSFVGGIFSRGRVAVQKIVGSILYYARAVHMTVLMALSTIASMQTKGTEQTMEKALQILDYLATHPDATIRFHATDQSTENPYT